MAGQTGNDPIINLNGSNSIQSSQQVDNSSNGVGNDVDSSIEAQYQGSFTETRVHETQIPSGYQSTTEEVAETTATDSVYESSFNVTASTGENNRNISTYIEPQNAYILSIIQELNITDEMAEEMRLELILNLLANNFSYEADANGKAWKTVEDTLATRSGDCEDLSNFAASLLIAAGFSAENVNIYVDLAENQGEQGHVVLGITVNGQEIKLDFEQLIKNSDGSYIQLNESFYLNNQLNRMEYDFSYSENGVVKINGNISNEIVLEDATNSNSYYTAGDSSNNYTVSTEGVNYSHTFDTSQTISQKIASFLEILSEKKDLSEISTIYIKASNDINQNPTNVNVNGKNYNIVWVGGEEEAKNKLLAKEGTLNGKALYVELTQQTSTKNQYTHEFSNVSIMSKVEQTFSNPTTSSDYTPPAVKQPFDKEYIVLSSINESDKEIVGLIEKKLEECYNCLRDLENNSSKLNTLKQEINTLFSQFSNGHDGIKTAFNLVYEFNRENLENLEANRKGLTKEEEEAYLDALITIQPHIATIMENKDNTAKESFIQHLLIPMINSYMAGYLNGDMTTDDIVQLIKEYSESIQTILSSISTLSYDCKKSIEDFNAQINNVINYINNKFEQNKDINIAYHDIRETYKEAKIWVKVRDISQPGGYLAKMLEDVCKQQKISIDQVDTLYVKPDRGWINTLSEYCKKDEGGKLFFTTESGHKISIGFTANNTEFQGKTNKQGIVSVFLESVPDGWSNENNQIRYTATVHNFSVNTNSTDFNTIKKDAENTTKHIVTLNGTLISFDTNDITTDFIKDLTKKLGINNDSTANIKSQYQSLVNAIPLLNEAVRFLQENPNSDIKELEKAMSQLMFFINTELKVIDNKIKELGKNKTSLSKEQSDELILLYEYSALLTNVQNNLKSFFQPSSLPDTSDTSSGFDSQLDNEELTELTGNLLLLDEAFKGGGAKGLMQKAFELSIDKIVATAPPGLSKYKKMIYSVANTIEALFGTLLLMSDYMAGNKKFAENPADLYALQQEITQVKDTISTISAVGSLSTDVLTTNISQFVRDMNR